MGRGWGGAILTSKATKNFGTPCATEAITTAKKASTEARRGIRALKEHPNRMIFDKPSPRIGLEHGRQATAALQRLMDMRALLSIRARATFRPVRDDQIAPVLPCEACGDGG